MKKFKINENYLIQVEREICKETSPQIYEMYKEYINFWDNGEYVIDIINYELCNTSLFRLKLHQIVKYFKNDNQDLHKDISNKNFTRLILMGIVEVID